jgi:hypothetical protein
MTKETPTLSDPNAEATSTRLDLAKFPRMLRNSLTYRLLLAQEKQDLALAASSSPSEK